MLFQGGRWKSPWAMALANGAHLASRDCIMLTAERSTGGVHSIQVAHRYRADKLV